jgi:hypothetical protein
VHAQAAECNYDRCALRLQFHGSGTRLVQGATATSVATIGLFAPEIAVLATASDSVRAHYEAFRTYHNRGAKLGLVSLATAVAGGVLYFALEGDARWVGVGVVAVGFGISLGASSNGATGRDHLQQSIWHYNRALATPP